MKTTHPQILSSLQAPFHRALWPVFALTVLAGAVPRLAADATAEPKTHTLFMGVDFSVEQNKQFYRVNNVEGGSFIIKVEGKEFRIPMERKEVSLKIEQSLKLSEEKASIGKLKGDRSYTPENDPVRKFAAAQMASTAQASVGPSASELAGLTAQQNSGAGATAMDSAMPRDAGGVQLRMNQTTRALNSETSALASDFNSPGHLAGRMEQELAAGMYDAMEVSFEVSAERPVRKPYVVVLAQFREKESKPGEVRNWIYATALAPLDTTPQKVRIVRGGFPRGFELKSYEVHLYDNGREVATNVADKQVALTREEAFNYMLIDYVGTHKGATLPASLAMGKLNPETKSGRSSEQRQAYYVKVSKNGLPQGAFADEACATPVDDMIGSVVKDFRFYPALTKGKAEDAVVTLRL